MQQPPGTARKHTCTKVKRQSKLMSPKVAAEVATSQGVTASCRLSCCLWTAPFPLWCLTLKAGCFTVKAGWMGVGGAWMSFTGCMPKSRRSSWRRRVALATMTCINSPVFVTKCHQAMRFILPLLRHLGSRLVHLIGQNCVWPRCGCMLALRLMVQTHGHSFSCLPSLLTSQPC